MNNYVLILAGGSGKRLWPLGRKNLPKQLIPFKGDTTLLDATIERMAHIVPRENIWILTVAEYHDSIQSSVGHAIGRIIIEPEARNTGPAIFYALQEMQKHDPLATLIVTPSDHAITDINGFVKTIKIACEYAQTHETIVLCGVQPEYPATGYGYIECGLGVDLLTVLKFHEKPTIDLAKKYNNCGSFLWNTGIFCASVQTLLQEFALVTDCCYATLPAISIDYMLFEKSLNLKVIKAQFDWSDVGTLDLFIAAQKACHKNVIAMNAHNVIAHGTKKLVVIMNVDDICVIETDDVLFVTKRSETEKIRNVVDYLKANGYEKFI